MTSESACSLFMVVLLIGGLTILSVSVPVHADSITVPDDYPTIQEAINAASEGDEIFVRAGLYQESVVIDKTVTLIGENRQTTISPIVIPHSEENYVVWISANNVSISGLTMRDAPRGLVMMGNSCLIMDNTITGITGFGGIFLDGRSRQVECNIIFNNSIIGNDDDGITMWNAKRNYVIGNNISENRFVGLYLYSNSSSNIVSDNEFTDNWDAAIVVDLNSDHNEIIYNSISESGMNPSNPYPVMLGCGIFLAVSSCFNNIIGNVIANSHNEGIRMHYYCDGNVIYHNSFVNNTLQFSISEDYPSSSYWDAGYPLGGNYWSDYNGTDVNKGSSQDELGSDGIGDTPYILDANNVDHYPLMQPYARLEGDVDGDGMVNMADLGLACSAFGSSAGSPKYNVMADLNLDLRIDLRDVAIICCNFGQH